MTFKIIVCIALGLIICYLDAIESLIKKGNDK
jgi:hypothetical protein